MAHTSLRNHPKFRRLVKLLKMPAVYVQGHLQALWDCGYAMADAWIGNEEDIELAAEWDDSGRQAGEFVKAAIECGFIDRSADQLVLGIHDLYDNAPDYVKKRMLRKEQRKNKDLQQKSADNGGQRRTTADNVRPPNPTQPNPTKEIHSSACADAVAENDFPEGMLKFWSACTQDARDRSSRRQVLSEWKRQKLEPRIVEVLAGVERWNQTDKHKNGFAEGAHRFLKNRKWTELPLPANTAQAVKPATAFREDR